MITVFSLYFNNDISFTYNQVNYDNDILNFNMYEAVCPCCGAVGFFIDHAHYSRYFSNSTEQLSIKRIRCTKCNHTHALLPEIIIPYRYFSSPIILKLFSLYLKNSFCVSKLEHTLKLSRQAIEKLIDFFEHYHKELFYMINPYLRDEFDYIFQREYFKRNHFLFMQNIHHKYHHNFHLDVFT